MADQKGRKHDQAQGPHSSNFRTGDFPSALHRLIDLVLAEVGK
jgi:hypothetical protein